MSSLPKSLHEINTTAIHILCQQMGLVNTLKFVNQFSTGYGDYTEDREKLFGDLSIDQIVDSIKKGREG